MIAPKEFKLVSGMGQSKYMLLSFDNALLCAGISNYNLLRVSSILPAGARLSGMITQSLGSPLLVAYATISSNEIGKTIATSISVAIPESEDDIGVIMEYEGFCSKQEAETASLAMAAEAMKNHHIKYKKILSTSIDAEVNCSDYVTLISAVPMW